MNSYIIRIYRNDSESWDTLTGLIQKTDDPSDEHVFTNINDLWKILMTHEEGDQILQ